MNESTALINEIKERTNDTDKNKYLEIVYQKGLLTEEVVEFLIENEICLDYLAHLPLSDNQLLILFKRNSQLCEEAAFTLIDRALKENVAEQDFHNIFSQCCNETVSKYLFGTILLKRDINCLLKSKILDAIQFIKQQYSIKEDIHKTAVEFENFLELRDTADVEFIKRRYNSNSYIYNMAISQNLNTPIEIINELCSLKDMKYSKIIRTNADEIRRYKK